MTQQGGTARMEESKVWGKPPKELGRPRLQGGGRGLEALTCHNSKVTRFKDCAEARHKVI